jgi:hypothetical protein
MARRYNPILTVVPGKGCAVIRRCRWTVTATSRTRWPPGTARLGSAGFPVRLYSQMMLSIIWLCNLHVQARPLPIWEAG